MDQPKIERVLRLMKMLTGNLNYTVDDIAERLEIDKRSVYRYIDTFKEAGFVVMKEGGVYRLGKESRFFKDISQLIHFSDEEAYIVNSLIDGLSDDNLIKQTLRRKLASVYNCTNMTEIVAKGSHALCINALSEAIKENKQVVLKHYASSNSADIRDRLVEPFGFTTNYVEVWCYDCQTGTNKLFNTARMLSVDVTSAKWKFENEHKAGFVDIFRISSYRQIRVQLELGVMAHNLLLEEFPLGERDCTPIDETHWMLDTKVSSYAGVGRFVIGLMDDIKIISSPGLEKYIKDFSAKYVK
jgi:predicted DNA-binding transcriptional regulator YafY